MLILMKYRLQVDLGQFGRSATVPQVHHIMYHVWGSPSVLQSFLKHVELYKKWLTQ